MQDRANERVRKGERDINGQITIKPTTLSYVIYEPPEYRYQQYNQIRKRRDWFLDWILRNT